MSLPHYVQSPISQAPAAHSFSAAPTAAALTTSKLLSDKSFRHVGGERPVGSFDQYRNNAVATQVEFTPRFVENNGSTALTTTDTNNSNSNEDDLSILISSLLTLSLRSSEDDAMASPTEEQCAFLANTFPELNISLSRGGDHTGNRLNTTAPPGLYLNNKQQSNPNIRDSINNSASGNTISPVATTTGIDSTTSSVSSFFCGIVPPPAVDIEDNTETIAGRHHKTWGGYSLKSSSVENPWLNSKSNSLPGTLSSDHVWKAAVRNAIGGCGSGERYDENTGDRINGADSNARSGAFATRDLLCLNDLELIRKHLSEVPLIQPTSPFAGAGKGICIETCAESSSVLFHNKEDNHNQNHTPNFNDTCTTASDFLHTLNNPLFHTSPPILMEALLESSLLLGGNDLGAWEETIDDYNNILPASPRVIAAGGNGNSNLRQTSSPPKPSIAIGHGIPSFPTERQQHPFFASPCSRDEQHTSSMHVADDATYAAVTLKQQPHSIFATPPPLFWSNRHGMGLSSSRAIDSPSSMLRGKRGDGGELTGCELFQPRLRLKLNRYGRSGDGPTFWGMWEDERSRMVYVSWLPRAARASDRSEKKKCELELKEFITKTLGFTGLQKVLLFPPSSAHCKLLFASEQAAIGFLATFGGLGDDPGPALWKSFVCEHFAVNIRGGIHATRVRIIWADQTKNASSTAEVNYLSNSAAAAVATDSAVGAIAATTYPPPPPAVMDGIVFNQE